MGQERAALRALRHEAEEATPERRKAILRQLLQRADRDALAAAEAEVRMGGLSGFGPFESHLFLLPIALEFAEEIGAMEDGTIRAAFHVSRSLRFLLIPWARQSPGDERTEEWFRRWGTEVQESLPGVREEIRKALASLDRPIPAARGGG